MWSRSSPPIRGATGAPCLFRSSARTRITRLEAQVQSLAGWVADLVGPRLDADADTVASEHRLVWSETTTFGGAPDGRTVGAWSLESVIPAPEPDAEPAAL